jgi:hypothetical protein
MFRHARYRTLRLEAKTRLWLSGSCSLTCADRYWVLLRRKNWKRLAVVAPNERNLEFESNPHDADRQVIASSLPAFGSSLAQPG